MSLHEVSLPVSTALPRRAALIVLLFATQTLALRLVDSVATVGYVSELGTGRLPWVWIGDLMLALAAGAIYFRVADRCCRVLLVRKLFILSAAGYLLCALLLWLGCSPIVCYTMAYIWSAQQVAVLPMALWTLANDLHDSADKARFFPRIAAGESIGHLAGYALTAWVGSRIGATTHAVDVGLLVAAASLCLGAALCVGYMLDDAQVPNPAAADGGDDTATVEARGTSADKSLRPLLFSVLFGWVAMTIIVFHAMASLEGAAGATPSRLRTLYGSYNLGLTLLTLGAQWIAGRVLARQRLEVAFIALPAVMAIGSIAVLPWPGIAGALALSAAMYLVHDAWDLPARHAWLGRVPADKRGRATAMLDNHAFVAGSVVASIALGVLCFNTPIAASRAPLYLAFSALAALASLLAAREMSHPRRQLPVATATPGLADPPL